MSVKIEDALGVPDGANKIFETSIPYIPGTLEVWINGVLNTAANGCWVELPPKQFEMNEAPIATDLLRVYYRY